MANKATAKKEVPSKKTLESYGYRIVNTIHNVRIKTPAKNDDKRMRFVPYQKNPGGNAIKPHWKRGIKIIGTDVILNQHFYISENLLGKEIVVKMVIKEKTISDGTKFSQVDFIPTPGVKPTCYFSYGQVKGARAFFKYEILNTDTIIHFYQLEPHKRYYSNNGINSKSQSAPPKSDDSNGKNGYPNAVEALKQGWDVHQSDGRQIILKKEGETITRFLPKGINSVQQAITMIESRQI